MRAEAPRGSLCSCGSWQPRSGPGTAGMLPGAALPRHPQRPGMASQARAFPRAGTCSWLMGLWYSVSGSGISTSRRCSWEEGRVSYTFLIGPNKKQKPLLGFGSGLWAELSGRGALAMPEGIEPYGGGAYCGREGAELRVMLLPLPVRPLASPGPCA